MSTATIFGGAALVGATQKEADQALEVLLKYGVNHIDTSPRYGDSEILIGKWIARHRKHFFLSSKVAQRTYPEALEEIHRSLDRLKTDKLDLLQLHGLQHPDEWDTALGPGGSIEAALEARRNNLVSYIGVTGHGWMVAALHRRALTRFDFDSVMLPYNYVMHLNDRYRNDFEELQAVCLEQNVAIQTIKSIARSPLGIAPRNRNTWYQPLEDPEDIDKAIHWVLGDPNLFVNTVGDLTLLPKVLKSAASFKSRPCPEEMNDMLNKNQMSSPFGIGT